MLCSPQRLWPASFTKMMTLLELRKQTRIAVPLVAMNLMWFARISITTAFLGRLGELQLVGGALGITIANVTGYSVLNGLCSAMEPICGQSFGAKNIRLQHKTLIMAISILLLTSLPISFLWLYVDKILLLFGQQEDISIVAKKCLHSLLPNLVIRSFLSPLKEYLNSQSQPIPIMISSAVAVASHVPINTLLSKAKGLEGVSMAVWISDLIVVIQLSIYVLIAELRNKERWNEGGWWEQGVQDWIRFLKLSGPCCLTTCLEWWCYEILVLLSGWLSNAKQAVGVLAIVLNFDYLLYSVNISLATSASIRVSNELGANQPEYAYQSAYASLAMSTIFSCIGGVLTITARGTWGTFFTNEKMIMRGVQNTMLIMALVEIVNFPLAVCGGIVRGIARPHLGLYANLSGFYLLALPLGIFLSFTAHLGIEGLLIGLFVGSVTCLVLLLVAIARINWIEEANKARVLTSSMEEGVNKDGDYTNSETVEMIALISSSV